MSHQEDCPYAPIDWAALTKQNGDQIKFHHPAVYPEDSILKDFMRISSDACEGADCYLIGSILPVVAALLGRRVFAHLGADKIHPNIYSLLVGKPGDRKSSTINIATRIAIECLPNNALLPHSFSPESMFDEYCPETGGRPDKLWLVDDANPILNDWKLTANGERVAARFLTLYDCKPITESFRRNKSDTTTARRGVPETSTCVLFGATFNVAAFQGQQTRAGLARRFLYYVADKHGRIHIKPPNVDMHDLADLFKSLLLLGGEVDFSADAFPIWEQYQYKNREEYDSTGYSEESLAGRLSTEPTHILKIAMIFEACRCVKSGEAMTQISKSSLECAMKHVEQNMRSSKFLESIAERSAISQQAEMILATIKRENLRQRADTVYVTRTDLTYSLCHNSKRRGAMTPDHLYNQIIPYLHIHGLAKLAQKSGKLEVYAFRIEEQE